MAISLNQFAPNVPVEGLYVYQANLPQLHNVIISDSQATVIRAGSLLALDAASTNVDAPVALDYDTSSVVRPFGIVTYTPVKNAFVATERVGIARDNDVVWLKAGDAIAVGDELTVDQDTDSDGNNIYPVIKLDTTDLTDHPIIGTALTPASAAGDLIQVELHFGVFLTPGA